MTLVARDDGETGDQGQGTAAHVPTCAHMHAHSHGVQDAARHAGPLRAKRAWSRVVASRECWLAAWDVVQRHRDATLAQQRAELEHGRGDGHGLR